MLGSASTALALTLLAASAEPVRLAAPGLKPGVLEADMTAGYGSVLAQELTLAGLKVLAPNEMAAQLTVEQQHELFACARTSASCGAELANALGAEGVVSGSLAPDDAGGYLVDLAILSAKDGTALSTYQRHVSGDALLDEMKVAARQLAAEVLKKLDRIPAVGRVDLAKLSARRRQYAEDSRARKLARIPLVGGLICAAGGGVLVGLAKGDLDALSAGGVRDSNGNLSLAVGRSAAARGALEQDLGLGLIGLGVAATVTGAIVYGVSKPAESNVLSLAPTLNGVVVSGVFP